VYNTGDLCLFLDTQSCWTLFTHTYTFLDTKSKVQRTQVPCVIHVFLFDTSSSKVQQLWINYTSLLQNIVSFIGLFCKKDLYYSTHDSQREYSYFESDKHFDLYLSIVQQLSKSCIPHMITGLFCRTSSLL